MKRRARRTLAGLLAIGACAGLVAGASADPGPGAMTITAAGEREQFEGSADNFTGEASISMLFAPNGPRDFGAAWVAFQPGARTAWHSHPAGQTLVVTEGHGWVQSEGGPRRDLEPGDVVWTPPGVRHWHGATTTSAMTHMAVQGAVDGTVVDWFEQVTQDQYLDGGKP